jgi:hypothetical protein
MLLGVATPEPVAAASVTEPPPQSVWPLTMQSATIIAPPFG